MPSSYPAHYGAWHALFGAFAFMWIFVLAAIVVTIIAYWRIASKAGYNGALSLLMLLPLVNFVMILIFAFGEWPIEQELQRLRSGRTPPAPAHR
jgi:amino acid transporter